MSCAPAPGQFYLSLDECSRNALVGADLGAAVLGHFKNAPEPDRSDVLGRAKARPPLRPPSGSDPLTINLFDAVVPPYPSKPCMKPPAREWSSPPGAPAPPSRLTGFLRRPRRRPRPRRSLANWQRGPCAGADASRHRRDAAARAAGSKTDDICRSSPSRTYWATSMARPRKRRKSSAAVHRRSVRRIGRRRPRSSTSRPWRRAATTGLKTARGATRRRTTASSWSMPAATRFMLPVENVELISRYGSESGETRSWISLGGGRMADVARRAPRRRLHATWRRTSSASPPNAPPDEARAQDRFYRPTASSDEFCARFPVRGDRRPALRPSRTWSSDLARPASRWTA